MLTINMGVPIKAAPTLEVVHMATSVLSFSVRIARHGAELQEASAVRAAAYGHHLPSMAPALAQALAVPDAVDIGPGTVVLVCRDKCSAAVVGTARIQRNHPQPLQIERSVALPSALADQPRAEITRLAILAGADAQVRPMLIKACYLYAVAAQIRWLVIGARSPALIRVYQRLGFDDLLGAGQQVPLAHAGGLPHSVLAFDVVAAERTWHAAQHGLYGFMVETWHPDLQLLAEPTAAPVPRPARPGTRPRLLSGFHERMPSRRPSAQPPSLPAQQPALARPAGALAQPA